MAYTRFTNRDFKSSAGWRERSKGRVLRLKKLHWIMLAVSGFTGASFLLLSNDKAEALGERTLAVAEGQRVESPLALPGIQQATEGAVVALPPAADEPESAAIDAEPELAIEPAVAGELDESWEVITVRSGDSLAAIFNRMGLSPRTLHNIMATGEPAKSLRRIFPGDEIRFRIVDGDLLGIRYAVDESVTLHVDWEEEAGFTTNLVANPLETHVTHASAVINSSLFLAGRSAGLNDRLIMELAGIFGWDIDFALDIRAGDRFRLSTRSYIGTAKRSARAILLRRNSLTAAVRSALYALNTPMGEQIIFRPTAAACERHLFARRWISGGSARALIPTDYIRSMVRAVPIGASIMRLQPALLLKRQAMDALFI
ncbi:hypothetical protein [Alkalilimnicola ehrlichii]|uniref:hypothetical protein n=1 Tax=Alkalilimnicola ehrlichii TaxID=351052 RepID=UPI00216314E2|nr:hypothetical protein [Alkalilimnicola ehrlichii]